MAIDEEKNGSPDDTAEPETVPIYDKEHGRHGFVEGVKNGCVKCTIRQRLKSKTVWAGILAQLAVIADMIYKIVSVGWDISLGEGIVFALLEIVTLFGVFNNPTSADEF